MPPQDYLAGEGKELSGAALLGAHCFSKLWVSSILARGSRIALHIASIALAFEFHMHVLDGLCTWVSNAGECPRHIKLPWLRTFTGEVWACAAAGSTPAPCAPTAAQILRHEQRKRWKDQKDWLHTIARAHVPCGTRGGHNFRHV